MASQIIQTAVPRLFSGIQPTGALHLGNYLGAVQRWVQVVQTGHLAGQHFATPQDRLFSVVDLHALTLPQDPARLRRHILDMTASLLACGLDAERCILFQQSDVSAHAELAWLLSCFCNMPRLSRLTQFREKSAHLTEVPLGLFAYPVLQSADVLLYRTTHVPVGEDNLQNLHITAQITKSWHHRLGPFWPEPQPLVLAGPAARLKSLRQPTKKMSKSDVNPKSCIFLDDTPDQVLTKCRKAVTDSISEVSYDPENRPGVSNLVTIHGALTGLSPTDICQRVQGQDTGQYKLIVAQALNDHLQPIQERKAHLLQHPKHIQQVLDHGAAQAREIAAPNLLALKRILGLKS
ncbi:hypothetical protein TCAL_01803 [Tigriopus californicus]|uniref:tryptophan--tRNA ligase n=1 Tax=Tigriopus californicus TaxID=6832 RepID=A0A553N8M1_TIGCA|nr:tryptophan--tRNA ligase, mitochondrial-like [Tigriopus californicus]TRY61760.1 hypothetical protein TCAL_01803 [Tigriopus californicus]|eukprot:TCALIF_01803-PA protein Name:"Similar to WARS2 Tryptophan--tRNA ligase, mitochondrial (Bos taurus)" AED:0.02 eAED:0.02 QI:0/-1/0/1/-1/1/1/0/348